MVWDTLYLLSRNSIIWHYFLLDVFDGLKYVVTDLGAEPLAQKEKMKTLQPLKVWVSHPLVNNAFVINCYCLIIIIIISVISSDPPCNDGYARFTTAPLKAFPDQVWIIHSCLCIFKLIIFTCSFSAKWLAYFLLIKGSGELTETNTSSQKSNVFFHSFN